MPLYWIVAKNPASVCIAEGGHLMSARMRAKVAGQTGGFVEAHELDAKTARKLKPYVGKVLTLKEAARLLNRVARSR
jgi:hypothetical protein